MALDSIHATKGPGSTFGKSLLQLADSLALRTLGGLDVAPYLGKATGTAGITDWNNLTTPGHSAQLMLGSLTNGPGDGNYYYVEVRSYNGNELVQIGHQYVLGAGVPMMVMRHRYTGAWGAWRRLYAPEDMPSFFARSNYASGTVPSGVQVYAIVQHNVGSNYNPANGRFTAPISGKYSFSGSALNNAVGTAVQFNFRLNGADLILNENSRSGSYGSLCIAVSSLLLAAGDYVDTYCPTASYGNLYTHFSGHLIS